MDVSRKDIEQALAKVMHPEINCNLVDLGMIKGVICKQHKVSLTLNLPFLQAPVKEFLIQSIKQALVNLDESVHLQIDIEEMSQEERHNFMKMAKEGWKL